MNLVIIGAQASGKMTVGQEVAQLIIQKMEELEQEQTK